MGLEELKKSADLRAEQVAIVEKAIKEKVQCMVEDFQEYFRSEGFHINDQNMSRTDKMLSASYKDIEVTLKEVRNDFSNIASYNFILSIKIDNKYRIYDIMIRKEKDVPLLGADSLILFIKQTQPMIRDQDKPITDFKQTLDELMNEGL